MLENRKLDSVFRKSLIRLYYFADRTGDPLLAKRAGKTLNSFVGVPHTENRQSPRSQISLSCAEHQSQKRNVSTVRLPLGPCLGSS